MEVEDELLVCPARKSFFSLATFPQSFDVALVVIVTDAEIFPAKSSARLCIFPSFSRMVTSGEIFLVDRLALEAYFLLESDCAPAVKESVFISMGEG